MTKIIFITATGTDIGKTYATCMILTQLLEKGYRVRAIKPIISGFCENALEKTDSGQLLMAMGMALNMENVAKISPWRFSAPLPPHMAAAQAGLPLIFEDIVKFCQTQSDSDNLDFLLIEGVGGVMVPLDPKHTTLDLMARLDCYGLMVTGSYLGTLSHSLSALACLNQRKIKVKGIILSESLPESQGKSLPESQGKSSGSYCPFTDVFEDFTHIFPDMTIQKLARNDKTAALADLIL